MKTLKQPEAFVWLYNNPGARLLHNTTWYRARYANGDVFLERSTNGGSSWENIRGDSIFWDPWREFEIMEEESSVEEIAKRFADRLAPIVTPPLPGALSGTITLDPTPLYEPLTEFARAIIREAKRNGER